MPVRTLHRDEFGAWVAAGGWVARPFGPSALTDAPKVKARHVGGSTDAIVESLDGTVRETWTSTGLSADDHRAGRIPHADVVESIAFYSRHRNPKRR
jgi:hypothetical protein